VFSFNRRTRTHHRTRALTPIFWPQDPRPAGVIALKDVVSVSFTGHNDLIKKRTLHATFTCLVMCGMCGELFTLFVCIHSSNASQPTAWRSKRRAGRTTC
jgi:hypothetical protein